MKVYITARCLEVIRKALQELEKKTGVSIYADYLYHREARLKYRVNWRAYGTQDPEEATKYAGYILEASKIASFLNRLEIIDNSDPEEVYEEITENDIHICIMVLKVADSEMFYKWVCGEI